MLTGTMTGKMRTRMITAGSYRHVLSIDLETYSPVNLGKAGVYVYAEHPDFEILLIGYSFDGGPVEVLDLTDIDTQRERYTEKLRLYEALMDPKVLKTAYNANFERTCLAVWLDREMPPEQWQDTMILAAELGLPRSLADVGTVLGLPEDQQKLKTGKQLITYFCKPCKPTKTNKGRTRNMPRHDPEKWAEFIEYNRRDVETEMAIREKLLRFGVNDEEMALWAIDQNINDRGVMLDRQMAEQATEMDTLFKDGLRAEAKELTGLDNPNSNRQVREWIRQETGIYPESIDKNHIDDVLKSAPENEKIVEYVNIRKELGKASTAKYKAMLTCVCEDDRIRGLTQFYGANRTGRWAGRLVQMQNLRQNKLPDEELDLARELVRSGRADTFERIFDPVDTLSQLIRTAFIPKPGHVFIVSDFSAIEARVLAWLADEAWRLEVFRTHGKIYEASAEQMFHLPPGSVKKGDPMRQKGKIAELALGYGGSVGALTQMGALDMGLSEHELKPLVNSWRSANPHITELWWELDRAVRRLLQTGRTQRLPHGVTLRKHGPLMRMGLPGGRELAYVKPKIIDDNITYEGVIQTSGGWGRIESYGPKFVENLVQATARDCLAVAMRRLEGQGIPIVFHVHDEVICEVPEGACTAEGIAEIMGEPISWAPGLPLRADAYVCEYYRKS